MTTLHTVSFQKTVLASLIGLCLSQSAFALQEISDKDLSQATGEGIAFLPQDFAVNFRGAGADELTTDIFSANGRSKDTGYVHLLPVGGLTSFVQDTNKDGKVNSSDHSVGKADLYLYGLSVSKNSSNDPNSRLDAGITGGVPDAAIKSWGTAANPWLFKAATAKNVPNFNTASTCAGDTDTSCQVTFLNFEAPLYESGTRDAEGVDAYNLKLALWADVFVLDQSKPQTGTVGTHNSADKFKLGESFSSTDTSGNRANRLRLQAIWNGFSVNGSNLQIFQTLNGATNTNGMSSFYNNTLGVSGVFRFNSGAADSLRAAVTAGSKTRYSADGEGRVYNSTTKQYDAVSNGIDTGSMGQTHNAYSGDNNLTDRGNPQVSTPGYTNRYSTTYIEAPDNATNAQILDRRYRLRTKDTVDVITTGTWTVPTGLYDKVLRLSTQECGIGSASGACADNSTIQGILTTPALNTAVGAPKFDSNDGIFIYNPNINLVLGSVYQPVILGSDGKNFSLEIARIPNKQEVYSRIYTRYAGDTGDSGVTYYGSTCNVYQCGTSDISGYQGGSVRENYSATALSGKKLATHSSISIGSVYSTDSGQTLQAFKGSDTQDAVGISFGKLNSTSSTSRTNYYYQLQAQTRMRANDNRWMYSTSLSGDITSSTAPPSTWNVSQNANCSTNYNGNNTCYRFNTALGNAWANITSFDIPCISNTASGGVAACSNSTMRHSGQPSGNNNLGYAPNAAHPTYTVGQNTAENSGAYSSGTWLDFTRRGGTPGTTCSTTDVNAACKAVNQTWTVNAWGGMGAYQNPDNTAQSTAQMRQNILNAYNANYAGTKWASNTIPDFDSIKITNAPDNNMGSAVIDGLLIQHFKITTKGL